MHLDDNNERDEDEDLFSSDKKSKNDMEKEKKNSKNDKKDKKDKMRKEKEMRNEENKRASNMKNDKDKDKEKGNKDKKKAQISAKEYEDATQLLATRLYHLVIKFNKTKIFIFYHIVLLIYFFLCHVMSCNVLSNCVMLT